MWAYLSKSKFHSDLSFRLLKQSRALHIVSQTVFLMAGYLSMSFLSNQGEPSIALTFRSREKYFRYFMKNMKKLRLTISAFPSSFYRHRPQRLTTQSCKSLRLNECMNKGLSASRIREAPPISSRNKCSEMREKRYSVS